VLSDAGSIPAASTNFPQDISGCVVFDEAPGWRAQPFGRATGTDDFSPPGRSRRQTELGEPLRRAGRPKNCADGLRAGRFRALVEL